MLISQLAYADRFSPVNPNAAYQEMSKRANDSDTPVNPDFIKADIMGKVDRRVRKGEAITSVTDASQGVVNSVVIEPGANTGDVYAVIRNEKDTNVVVSGRGK